MTVKNAVEIFVRITIGPGVLDEHPVIGQLLVFREIETVKNTFDPLAIEGGVNIVAR